MYDALEGLKDDKFRVAVNFSADEFVAQPLATKIVSSVLCAYTKILARFCPYKDLTSGVIISNYFTENFNLWFADNFTKLSLESSVAKSLRNKTRAWFITNLKRQQNKMKNNSSSIGNFSFS